MAKNQGTMSRSTADRLPGRALTLLTGIGTNLTILGIMRSVGFTEQVYEQGRQLLLEAAGLGQGKPNMNLKDTRVANALAEIDALDEPLMKRIEAALTHHHPEQSAFVFENLAPAQGPESVVGMTLLLGRLGKLEEGRSDATRADDQAAIATLAERGITTQERARVGELIAVAQTLTPAQPAAESDLQAAREEKLKALMAWYADWSETARAVLHRRDHLIRLGLAKRRSKKDAPPTTPEPATP